MYICENYINNCIYICFKLNYKIYFDKTKQIFEPFIKNWNRTAAMSFQNVFYVIFQSCLMGSKLNYTV